MFDWVFANSYVELKYGGRQYLSESYETLQSLMNDSSSTITVHVVDFITGIFENVKTFNKSDISYYGRN